MKINNLILIFFVFFNFFTTHPLENGIQDEETFQTLLDDEFFNNFTPLLVQTCKNIYKDQIPKQFDKNWGIILNHYNNAKQIDTEKVRNLNFNSLVEFMNYLYPKISELYLKSFNEHFHNTTFNCSSDKIDKIKRTFISNILRLLHIAIPNIFMHDMLTYLKNKLEELKIDQLEEILKSLETKFHKLIRNFFKSKNINLDSIDNTTLTSINDIIFSITGKTLNINFLTKKCFVCKEEDKLNKCSGCKLIYYCSKACRDADWKRHKLTCKKKAKADAGDEKSNAEEEKEAEEVSQQRFESPMRPSFENGDEPVSEPRVEPVD